MRVTVTHCRTSWRALRRSPRRAAGVAAVCGAACALATLSRPLLGRLTTTFTNAGNARSSLTSLTTMRSTATATAPPAANPLLDNAALPKFKSINADHVTPAVDDLVSTIDQDFAKFASGLGKDGQSFDSVFGTMEKLKYPLGYTWGVVSHLNSVKNSDKLRDAYMESQAKVVKISMQMEQSREVYDALEGLAAKPLSETQKRIVESSIRSMKNSGVSLPPAEKEQFSEIALKLSELGTTFQNHLLDATKAFELVLTSKEDVAGLPTSALGAAAQSYTQAYPDKEKATAEDGPWRLTLDLPSYISAMKHMKSSALRQKLYMAFITRASEGERDNGPLIKEILSLKQQATKMIGYETYADQSLAAKMADSVADVDKLTADLFAKARPAAERELKELQEFANSKGYAGELQLWDTTFWAERMKEEKFAYDEEALRPFFSLPKVLDGLFGISKKLFGIEIERDDAAAERWHEDVMFFKVKDAETGEHMASFYLDPYARPGEKRGGAWMADCIGRSKTLSKKPVAYLTCNGSPPIGDKPSLMTFSEAETLFHEFGHGLQHMLTTVEEADAAGINNVEWDAVELPSQFMENWLYHKPTVDSFAVHYETGEKLPEDVFEKIKGSRVYMAGTFMLRQLQLGALDMELHARYDPETSTEGPFDVQRRIATKYAILKPLPEDRFLASFSHIFAGGYAAGYYSYKWAEVLSADAFAAFEEAGLDDEAALAATGRRFRQTVLGEGGSRAPAEVYREFRGKDATVDALLRHNGLM
eukprot:TRINITY_DN113480_c0_g1_i1.p1 TRINITY_DN113480_c0_g1~~TRINITY_DN113480_c0_g1_i1.p1  ORF type:complete len:763 (+),score=258.44 TRINITY_DN113480_c0_g1_i1:69-2357(+)